MQNKIVFFTQSLTFTLRNKNAIRIWLLQLIATEKYQFHQVNFIFCNDKYLHKINLQYLKHNNYTDIITFDNSNTNRIVEGDIFISIQRVKENAKTFNIPFRNELLRVMAHGILHLCGYKDKTPKAKLVMTIKEDYYLSLRSFW